MSYVLLGVTFVWTSVQFMKCFNLNNICLIGGYSTVFVFTLKSIFFSSGNQKCDALYDDVITTMLFRACRVLIYCLMYFHMLHIFLFAVYSYAAGCCAIDQFQPSCLLNYKCNISSNHIFCEWFYL